ncbi:TIGR04141 family sporadically distributed protein [Cobetia amphilecti]|uniref:TIGR04141 family sporadically distributed protein n=1 Tax=Cobetia amphilecti TaxID=1055104 RepID=UPI003297D479
MKKNKIRKEKFNIYLIKPGCKLGYDDIIHEDGCKYPVDIDISGFTAKLFVKKEALLPPPPWTKLFTEHQELPLDIFSARKTVGAVFIIEVDEHVYALSFGSGFHLIKNEAIERDFGLKVTLNSVDPEKLRSLDKASYDYNPINSRAQSSIDLGALELDVNSEMDMLYAVTGISKNSNLGTHVTGRDALTLFLEIELKGLPEILREAYSVYKRELPKEFEWVDNIQRVRDLDTVSLLDMELDEVLGKKEFDRLWLGEPEIVDWESQIGYSFDLRQRTPRHVLLNLNDLVEYFLNKRKKFTVEELKLQSIHINDNEYSSIKKWSAYRCLYAEIDVGSERYILRNGVWYKVNTDFVASVDNCLRELDVCDLSLPMYSFDKEGEYNSYVASNDDDIGLMDKRNVQIGAPRDKVEFCDLIKGRSQFIHVKYYSGSATLSHLFSQGFVSAEAFIGDVNFREKLNSKLPSKARLEIVKQRPNPSEYSVIYAIAINRKIPECLRFFEGNTEKRP